MKNGHITLRIDTTLKVVSIQCSRRPAPKCIFCYYWEMLPEFIREKEKIKEADRKNRNRLAPFYHLRWYLKWCNRSGGMKYRGSIFSVFTLLPLDLKFLYHLSIPIVFFCYHGITPKKICGRNMPDELRFF